MFARQGVVLLGVMVGSVGAPSAWLDTAASRHEVSPVTVRTPEMLAEQTGGARYRLLGSAPGQPGSLDPAGCELHPSQVYLRTSSNKEAVGFKPYTTCKVPVQVIRQKSRLNKYRFFGLRTGTVGPEFSVDNSGEDSLTQRNIEVMCTNTKKTTWFGVVQGQVVENGHTYYQQVRTKDEPLACGT
jgi:hypothetical protein